MMKKDIILSGVGGQGILSIAAVIGTAALSEGLHIKQAEVHGMSQRGGDVHSDLRISSRPVHSDLIPRGGADLIISLEPMEALRYLPWLDSGGWVVASSAPFVNIPSYPEPTAIVAELDALPRSIVFDVEAAAREAGIPRAANMVLLGAASGAIGIAPEALREAIRILFNRKGPEVVEMNLRAFEIGRRTAETAPENTAKTAPENTAQKR